MDISNLSVADLKSLLESIPTEIKRREKEDKARIRKELEALAEKSGYTLDELLGEAAEKVKKTRKQSPIRYRSADGQKNWTGQGRTPKWLSEAIAAGASKESFAV
jgi:DNA-binding protein H-NS